MIPALLLQAGLPLLAKWIGGALEKVEHPAAKAAAGALADVTAAISTKQITPEQLAEANRHVEAMAKLDSEEYREVLREVNATMRVEAQADDEYTRRWRPFWGYASAYAWQVQTYTACVAVIAAIGIVIFGEADKARIIFEGLAALFEAMSEMWMVALAVLGVGVYQRSRDKARAAGVPSMFETIIDRVTKRNPAAAAPPATGKKS